MGKRILASLEFHEGKESSLKSGLCHVAPQAPHAHVNDLPKANTRQAFYQLSAVKRMYLQGQEDHENRKRPQKYQSSSYAEAVLFQITHKSDKAQKALIERQSPQIIET